MNDREKLIENAKRAMKSENLSCNIARNGFVADFLIANGVTIQRWIPVTERLPEKWQNVLTVRTDGGFRLDFIGSAGVWYEDVDFVRYPVTHWMPLPEPPKEVE